MTGRSTPGTVINRSRSLPDRPDLSLAEATYFLAFGVFISADGLDALFKTLIPNQSQFSKIRAAALADVQGKRKPSQGKDEADWSKASERILDVASAGKLTLNGRPGDPKAPRKHIPTIFFAGKRTLVIGPDSILWDKKAPSGELYYDVILGKDEFKKALKPKQPSREAKREEKNAILALAEKMHRESGQPPSFDELWKQFPQVSRLSLRAIVKDFPDQLKRKRGQRTSAQ